MFIKSGFVKFMRPPTPVRFSKNPMDMYPKGTKALAALMKRLSDTDDVRLLVMIWAMHTLQGKRAAIARNYIRFPREAYNAQIGSIVFRAEMGNGNAGHAHIEHAKIRVSGSCT
ncbi:hypothetical protein [Sinorhizobium meliloti]|uniref:hypothetical protein n=1 Tax=Rhizobium meliloti TaxID=382 RepID=UPI001F22159B|nr:hypothetical protein [Sinorhizobium meliloti]